MAKSTNNNDEYVLLRKANDNRTAKRIVGAMQFLGLTAVIYLAGKWVHGNGDAYETDGTEIEVTSLRNEWVTFENDEGTTLYVRPGNKKAQLFIYGI